MKITFEQLLEIGHDLSGVGEGFKNYQTALRRYLKARGIPAEAYVPETLVEDLDRFVADELPELVSPRQLAQQKSITNRWGLYWTRWVTGEALPRKFSSALQQLMDRSGVSQKALAEHLGVDASTVRGYQRGRHKPGRQVLLSVEAYFGLEPGILSSRVDLARNGPVKYPSVKLEQFPPELQGRDSRSSRLRTMVRKALPSDYMSLPKEQRERALQASAASVLEEFNYNKTIGRGYRLPYAQWPERLKAEWNDLVVFKRGPAQAEAAETPGGRYQKAYTVPKRQPNQPQAVKSRRYWNSPKSVRFYLTQAENFFGYLTLPATTDGGTDPGAIPATGKGMDPSDMTLALFLNTSLVYDFVEFQSDRAGNYNTTSGRIYSFAAQLVQERSGWLRARPDLLGHLSSNQLASLLDVHEVPEAFTGDVWTHVCNGCLLDIRGYSYDLRDILRRLGKRHIRRIRPILDLDFPLDLFDELNSLGRRHINQVRSPRERGRLLQDLVISRILTETSLRVKHLSLMRYGGDNTGQLRRQEDGSFYLVIPVSEFKNASSREVFEGYGEVLFSLEDEDLQRDLAEYIDVVLPAIASRETGDYVFPVYSTGEPSTTSYLASRVRAFSKRYLKLTAFGDDVRQVGEFGPHTFRYGKGASMMKMEGGGVTAAANALLDTEEVTRNDYAWILASQRHEQSAAMVRDHRSRRSQAAWRQAGPRLR